MARFSALTLLPLSDEQLQREPNLRAAVSDQVSGTWPWPQAAACRATWAAPAGGLPDVAMLRIQGPTRPVDGSGWDGLLQCARRAPRIPWPVRLSLDGARVVITPST